MASNPLPINVNPYFGADMPDAIVYPAHPTNYYLPHNHGGVANQPRAFILHTPEEPWDDNESTPNYFRSPNRQASTHYYQDSDGDIYQLVPEFCAAIANGLWGKPLPSWARAGSSLNWQTLSVEIEGYAHSIQYTLRVGEPQWRGLVKLIRNRCQYWDIPMDREHIMGHYELSVDRSDPGAGFPWQELILDLNWGPEDEGGEGVIFIVEDPTTAHFDTYLGFGMNIKSKPIPDYQTRKDIVAFYNLLGVHLKEDPVPISASAFTYLKSK